MFLVGDLLCDADPGCQFTSPAFSQPVPDWGVTLSYVTFGDCLYNAAMELTWATINKKIGQVHGDWIP